MRQGCQPIDVLKELISRRSVTPSDAGCSEIISRHLQALGFKIEWLNRGDVTNLWATHGEGQPLFLFAGHTDVVPPGPEAFWSSDPFQPTIRDGRLFGRGAADMKSGLAAMVGAFDRLFRNDQQVSGTVGMLLTSDEEGAALDGTRHVADILRQRGVRPDFALVGEAVSEKILGDRIVVGRRGSLGCDLSVFGKQGHVAYPARADNPIHRLVPAISELITTEWDRGNQYFPPTTLQISNIHSGTGADNVIPGEAGVVFNFRYGNENTAENLRTRTTGILSRHLPKFQARWHHSGEPFLTRKGALVDAAKETITAVTGITDPQNFTGGGTSDARFLAPLGTEVIEIGPVGESIHKADENVLLGDLDRLCDIYHGILLRLCCHPR